MASIHTIEILRDALSSTPIDIGQVIYCTDTIELFYDDSNNTRIQLSVQILQTESDRLALGSPEEKIYFVLFQTFQIWRNLAHGPEYGLFWMVGTALVKTPIIFTWSSVNCSYVLFIVGCLDQFLDP